ncbi:MAG: nucleoside-diphosphate kinase [Proteobacteria bacterium]|nr:nucleoside-diphosphate kinase [Pseudomonadota bacterium]
MAIERTLSMIKPDGVERNLVGVILSHYEAGGLRIKALRRQQLSLAQGRAFYAVHKKRPFYEELVNYIVRSPVVVSVLEGDNAVTKHRHMMGATNPEEAAADTIRKKYAQSLQENTVHGSDSLENAAWEVSFFFALSEYDYFN